ncbi:MAG: adenylosuccinate synthase [Bacteroidia bacterium]|nr:adenylosuccinate synthase [Bacteroidia bacterium]MDW8346345.1 adenylosuccinate synthase [Bacteroidia bacterium]
MKRIVDIVLGLQWGDEGKGKIVDVIAPKYDIIARFQGGPNAGHTIEFENKRYVLHTIPSGIFHEGITCVIGNGLVIDLITLREEIERLINTGIPVKERLIISDKAHLILPTHKALDSAYEQAKGSQKIGSTLRGISPSYQDKIGRNGLRMGDILLPDFEARYYAVKSYHYKILEQYHYPVEQIQESHRKFFDAVAFIQQFRIQDTALYLNNAIQNNKKILAEGAQGSLLDVDFGSYPYVTSSNTTAAGACTGLGIPPNTVNEVYGVFKAYCTRVGSGPFPTELDNELGEYIRIKGNEYGSTTGRKRRTGWLDIPALNYAIMLSGVTQLIQTKADVLSQLEEIQICVGYLYQGKKINYLPYNLQDKITPEYITVPGWKQDISQCRNKADLPEAFMNFIETISRYVNAPIQYISVGPDRSQIFSLN